MKIFKIYSDLSQILLLLLVLFKKVYHTEIFWLLQMPVVQKCAQPKILGRDIYNLS